MKIPKPHQVEGGAFLAARKRGALWYKPRVGKTLSTVVGLEKLGVRNVLVVCPVTVMPVWQQEFEERGWPEARLVQGSRSQKLDAVSYQDGPVICSFESAWRLPTNQRKWDAIVFDESIRLWNWQAKQVKHWHGNEHLTEVCILLSGAPCPEGYIQLASQMLICRGIWFGHKDIYSYLREFWQYNSEKYRWECDDMGHLAEIKRRLNIVGLSKSLADVGARDEKLYSTMPVKPSSAVAKRLKEIADSDLAPVSKALRSQMLANGLGGEGDDIFIEDTFKSKALKDYIDEQLEQEPDYACVVMCRFREQVEHLAGMLNAAMIHGGIIGKARQEAIDSFQAGKCKYIVCQAETAKMGIDLSRGKEIHFFSNSWAGDTRIQAQERCSNLNKSEAVGIIDWCTEGSIEFAIAGAVANKEDFQNTLLRREKVTEYHRLAEAVCDLVNAPHSEHMGQNGYVTSVTIPWPLYRELKERYNSLLDELRRN